MPISNGVTMSAGFGGLGLTMLRMLWVGDSITQGTIQGALVAGTDYVGPSALNSPLDEGWLATSGGVVLANNGIGSYTNAPPHANTDVRLTNTQPRASIVQFVPVLLRAAFPQRFGAIRFANLAMGGSSTYSWSGNCAVGSFFGPSALNVGDTVTIAGTTYTAVDAPANPYEFKRDASNTTGLVNLANAINAEGTPGTWGPGTPVNPTVFVPVLPTASIIQLTSRAVGAAGNGAILSAAAGGRLVVNTQMVNGDDYASLLYHGQQSLAEGAGFGQPDLTYINLGTNDSTCLGWRGLQSYAHYTALLNRLKADYPSSRFVLTIPMATSLADANAVIAGVISNAIAQCVADNPGRVFSCSAFALPDGDSPTQIRSLDGIHPTLYGYQLLGQLWARAGAHAMGLI